MSDGSARPARRWGPFRLWEMVVIAIAIVLFVLAAFAGPRGTPSSLPSAIPIPSLSEAASGEPAEESELPVPAPTGSPVATVDQILAEEVADYTLVDQGLSEAGASGGALQSVELRYSLTPPSAETDIFHAIEVHASAEAANERVKTFGAALSRTGFTIAREQPLRSAEEEIQGYFIALRGEGQRLLLWSNRNVTFSLGGGAEANVDAFYDALPY